MLIKYEPCIANQCSGVLFGSAWSKFLVSENLQTSIHSLQTHNVFMYDKTNCKPLIVAAVRQLYVVLTHITLHQHSCVTKFIYYCLDCSLNCHKVSVVSTVTNTALYLHNFQ